MFILRSWDIQFYLDCEYQVKTAKERQAVEALAAVSGIHAFSYVRSVAYEFITALGYQVDNYAYKTN